MANYRTSRNSKRSGDYDDTAKSLSKDPNPKTDEMLTDPSISLEKITIQRDVQHRSLLALFCVFMASVFIFLSSVTIKKINHFDSYQLNLVINIWQVVGNIPFLVYAKQSLFSPKQHRFLLFVRAVLAVAVIYCNTFAFRLLPVAEVAIIYSLMPGMSTIIARIFLKERCGIVQSASLILTIVGVLLSLRLPELMRNRTEVLFTAQYVFGLACTVGFVLGCGFAYMLLRLTKNVHYALQNMYSGILGLVTCACLTASVSAELPHCGWDSILMLAVGLLSFIGYNFIIHATQLENVGIVTMVKSSMDVIVALIFQIIFFLQYPDAYNSSGAAIVIVSATVVGLSRWLHLQPAEAAIKKKLGFLLL